ncbi:hypothetical protein AgCh_008982 [Apium graveolens]
MTNDGTKPSPFKHSLKTNNAEYLSRNPLKTINDNFFSQSPLTPLSTNIEFSQNLQFAVPVVGNYQSSDKERLATGQMLMSSLHEVQVDSNFRPSFEKPGTDGYCLNTKPNAKPNLKQPGVLINGEICATPDTPCVHKLLSMGFEGDFNNVEDCDSSDSDCISSGDCDDVDVHEFDNTVTKWSEYLDVGDPDKICSKCQAIMWNHERNNKSATRKPPTFSLCCKNGLIILDKEKQPPEPLASLLIGGSRFRHLKENIRIIGSFVPLDGEMPKFCQIYIYGTEDEVHNRINVVMGGRDAVYEDIVQSLLEILDKHNRLVKDFRMTRERISQNAVDKFRLVLISSCSASGRPNHIGPSNEVVGLIVTDEYGLTPHLGGYLWQQYVVDTFTAIEQYRLDWIRGHQTTIRSDMYHNIRYALNKGDNNPENVGKATILPASFSGSKRYMNQYFKDTIAICRTLGHPSLFLMMTTYKKWPEIQRMLKFLLGVDVVDAPDVVARVFKMKVDQLLDQIKNKNCFGRSIGAISYYSNARNRVSVIPSGLTMRFTEGGLNVNLKTFSSFEQFMKVVCSRRTSV